MACKLDESTPTPFYPHSLASDLISCTEEVLGFKKETTPHLFLKPGSESGTVLFIPRNRKLLEEKLIHLSHPSGGNAECQLFNFSEKFREELVAVLNENMPQLLIRHYGLVYNKKICAIIGSIETNKLIATCFNQLLTGMQHPNNTIYGHVILNLKQIEDVVLDQHISHLLTSYVMGKEMGIMNTLGKGKANPTVESFRSNSISLSLKNLICLQTNPVKLVDGFEWRDYIEEVVEQIRCIYQSCEKSSFMMKEEEETKMKFENLHENMLNCAQVNNTRDQNFIEILVFKKDGSYSKEVLLAGLILFVLKTQKVTENERILFLFNQRLKDYLIRSLHLLCSLGFLNNISIDLLAQYGSKQSQSDLTALMDARRDYLYQMLLERNEETGSINCKEMKAKANELCEIITKFELLSHPTSQDAKLVHCDKVGTHNSMFVLYNYARIVQILTKFEYFTTTGIYPPLTDISETDFTLLALDKEWHLFVNYILNFPLLLSESLNITNPLQPNCISNICQFMISLSQHFSTYYSKTKILTQPEQHLYSKMSARIHLLAAVRRVMDICFGILDIRPLERI